METSLHRQLKQHYARPNAIIEAPLGQYRIDVLDNDRVIEIQHSSLASIRQKTKTLLAKHRVEIVKPLIARKKIVKLDKKGGAVKSSRWSPKRGTAIDLFQELIYFTSVFPHPRLTLRIPLVEIEESRYPHRRRWFRGQFKVQDQTLVKVISEDTYSTRGDLIELLPANLPSTFGTLEIAEAMSIDRWMAQKIAYCLRETDCVKIMGKVGNSIQYQFVPKRKRGASVRKTLSAKKLSEKKPSAKKTRAKKAKKKANSA